MSAAAISSSADSVEIGAAVTRLKLQALARQGQDDANERERVNDLMKNLARLKAVSRYLR